VFLQRFGIEPMLPNGQRVSTMTTEAAGERATVRCCLARPAARAAASRAASRQVDEKCVSCGHKGLSFFTMQARRRRLPSPQAHAC
jgi:DNA-directed RNA polymerase subunit M/transcription elongation factor TFIIS